jgi:hypothetical protein
MSTETVAQKLRRVFRPVDRGLRFAGHERVAVDAKRARVGFAVGALERVDRGTDRDVNETCFFNQCRPACTRQATGNSTRPQIDLTAGFLGNWFGVGNVRELQDTPRA